MKKLLVLSLIFITSCRHFQTKEGIAHRIVKEYLDSTLNDPKSYESVSFSKLDTGSSNYLNSPNYVKLQDSLISHTSELSSLKIDLQFPDLYNSKVIKYKIKKLLSDSVYYQKKMDSVENNFKTEQTGWILTHTYRAKNGFGALGLHTTVFELDTNLTKIINVLENN